jgi:hypothetical protein
MPALLNNASIGAWLGSEPGTELLSPAVEDVAGVEARQQDRGRDDDQPLIDEVAADNAHHAPVADLDARALSRLPGQIAANLMALSIVP